jgi:hypothetical protein
VYSTASREGASADAGRAAIVASVRTRNRAALVALAGALIAAPAVALAKPTPVPKATSPLLWATIDVCDTATHPNTIGIRGSMPGTGDRHEQMYMQFVVEYRSPTGHWHYLKDGESALAPVGNGSSKARQAGQDFQVARSSTQTYTLRGVVVFEWRANGRTIAQAVRATHAGHTAGAGADPPDYSAATCTITRKAAGRS